MQVKCAPSVHRLLFIGSPILVGIMFLSATPRSSAQYVLRVHNFTPDLRQVANTGTILSDISAGVDETSSFIMDGDRAFLLTPGDGAILLLGDQDDALSPVYYRFTNHDITWDDRSPAFTDTATRRLVNQNDGDVDLATDGPTMRFVTDLDGDQTNTINFRWHNNGTTSSDRLMELINGGSLNIAGTFTQNVAFDLAEAFLRTEPIAAGQLVAVDATRHDGVRLTSGVHDRAVIGVASTQPGIILGHGAFSVERIAKNWGQAHADRFRVQQPVLQERVLAEREDLQTLQARIESFGTFSAGRFGFPVDETMIADESAPADPQRPHTVKRNDWEALVADYAAEQLQFADELEGAAIDLFLKETLVPVALAGRVP
ncbi:MAG: hypothetical protein KDA75_07975, partial [Planctomycetaceae bacterium]|nr:hypothetical protein [Planctomycetaceae bacterium]